jgi:predicted glycosyltransferase
LEKALEPAVYCQPGKSDYLEHMNNDMGKVIARIKVENWLDSELIKAGVRKEKPRCIETEALVDTAARLNFI